MKSSLRLASRAQDLFFWISAFGGRDGHTLLDGPVEGRPVEELAPDVAIVVEAEAGPYLHFAWLTTPGASSCRPSIERSQSQEE
jgi:hypothetical protein